MPSYVVTSILNKWWVVGEKEDELKIISFKIALLLDSAQFFG